MDFTIRREKRIFFSRKAQTMIELVVAIGIILMGVVSTLVLTTATIRGGKASEMQVIAANLAREGIEVVKQKRDNNWLKIESNVLLASQWDDELKETGDDYTALAKFDPDNIEWSLDYDNGTTIEDDNCIGRCSNPNSTKCCQLYLQNGVYTHDRSGQETPYYRLITTNEICKESDGDEYFGTCIVGDEKIGIQAISQVKWYEKNHLESLTLEEHLYNWKY